MRSVVQEKGRPKTTTGSGPTLRSEGAEFGLLGRPLCSTRVRCTSKVSQKRCNRGTGHDNKRRDVHPLPLGLTSPPSRSLRLETRCEHGQTEVLGPPERSPSHGLTGTPGRPPTQSSRLVGTGTTFLSDPERAVLDSPSSNRLRPRPCRISPPGLRGL